MFCKYCGKANKDGAKFCCGCGQPLPLDAGQSQAQPQFQAPPQPQQMGTPTPGNAYGYAAPGAYGYAGSPAPKKSGKKLKPILAIVAILVVISIAVGVVFQVLRARPMTALATGMQSLGEGLAKMESGRLTMTVKDEYGDSATVEFEYSMDAEERTLYGYGTVEADGETVDMAILVEDSYGAIGMRIGGDVDYETIPSYELEMAWDSMDQADSLEEIDVEQYLDDMGVLDEIDDYFDADEINRTFEDVMKELSSSSVQGDLEDALEVEKEGLFEKTYTVSLRGSNLADAAKVVLDVFEDEAGDAIRGDWLDEVRDELDYGLEDLGDLGDLSWSVKGGKMTALSYSGDVDGVDFDFDMDFSYSGSDLESLAAEMSIDGTKIQVEVSDINGVGDVKDSIPSDLMDVIEY